MGGTVDQWLSEGELPSSRFSLQLAQVVCLVLPKTGRTAEFVMSSSTGGIRHQLVRFQKSGF